MPKSNETSGLIYRIPVMPSIAEVANRIQVKAIYANLKEDEELEELELGLAIRRVEKEGKSEAIWTIFVRSPDYDQWHGYCKGTTIDKDTDIGLGNCRKIAIELLSSVLEQARWHVAWLNESDQ